MIIEAQNPVIIPATEEQIYDAWVITHMAFIGEGIERTAECKIFFRMGHKNQDSSWILSDRDEDKKIMHVEDIWEEAMNDMNVLLALQQFLGVIRQLAINKGVI